MTSNQNATVSRYLPSHENVIFLSKHLRSAKLLFKNAVAKNKWK